MRLLLAAALLLQAVQPALAAVPQRLNYQGKLANSSGDPLTGTYSFRFKFFSQDAGGSSLWSEDVTGANAVSVANGIYTVAIGSLTTGGIPAGVFEGSEVFIEIDVKAGSDLTSAETLSPRERLSASAYAVHALAADKLANGVYVASFTSAGQLAVPGALTASSGTFTASGATQYSVTTTSGVNVGTGPLYLNTGGYLRFPDGTTQTTALSAGNFVLRNGDTMTGALAISGYGITASSGTFTATGNTQYSIATSSGITVGGSGGVVAAFLTGTANTAKALAADGADCTSGNAPLGVDTAGAASGCFDVGTQAEVDAKVAKAGDTMTGQLTINGSTLTVNGAAGVGAVGLSNGTLVVQSTSSTAGNPVISAKNNAGSELFRIQQDGNMALGATSTLYGGSARKLAVIGNTWLENSDLNLFMNDTGSAADNKLWRFRMNGANFVADAINDANNITTNWLLVSRTGTTVNSVNVPNGSVGIGNSSPGAKLHVTGEAAFTSGITASSGTFLATGAGQYSVTTSSGVNVGGGPLYLNTGGYLRFPDGTTQTTALSAGNFVAKAGDTMTGALTISQSGEDLLLNGDTGSPAIELRDTDGAGLTPYIDFSTNTGDNYHARIDYNTTGGQLALRAQTFSFTANNGAASGNVGVGTAYPATALDVNGTAQFGGGATRSTFTATGALQLAASLGVSYGGTGAADAGSARSNLGAAASGSNSDITALTALTAGGLADSTVYGQDIAASTITLNKLNQSGCGLNEVIAWGGSAFGCVAAPPDSTKVAKTGDTMTGQLTINGSSLTVTGAVGVGAIGHSNGTLVVQSTSATAGNPVIAAKNNAGSELFRIQQDGNMALGAATTVYGGTAQKLVVIGDAWFENSAPNFYINSTGSSADNKLWRFRSASGALLGQVVDDTVSSTANWLHVTRSGASVSTVNLPNGNVGIGNAAPGAKLHVTGEGAFTSGITASSGTFTASGATQYSIATSSGINVGAGGVVGAFFTGTANVAKVLATDGADCSAGNAPLGVDTAGAASGCFDVATQTELDAHTTATSVHSATDQATASRIVIRDSAGGFAAAGVTASSGTFTASGATQYSITTSSGINVGAGPLYLNTNGYIRFPDGTTQATGLSAGNFVAKAGDTMTGALAISGYGITAASGTFTATGNTQYSIATSSGITVGGSGGVVAAFLTGTANTAKALAADGADCSAGNSPLGVDAAGAASGCFDVATQTELDAHTTATSVHSATNQATASRIVIRDSAGGFAAAGVTASSGTFTATGNTQYSIATSSGINVGAGGVVGAFFTGTANVAKVLAADGADCSAGNAPLGVDTAGAASGCFDVATQTELDAHTTATSAHSATDQATASRIVIRDSAGGFAAAGVTASSGTFTATGATQYSITTSSGINVAAGPLYLNTNGYVRFGDGTTLTTAATTDSTKVAKAGDTMTGQLTISGSSLTVTGGAGVLVTYGVKAASATLTGNITASSGTFTATGTTQYSIATSSGINVGAGGVVAAFFAGTANVAKVLAADGADCSAGNAPLGVDTAGAASGCFDVGTQAEVDAKLAKAGDTMTGQLTINGSSLTVTGAAGIGGTGLSNGTLVIKSTSSTAANPVIDVRNNSNSAVFSVRQDGASSFTNNVVVGGTTHASGAGTTDLTGTGSIFFGTGGSYKVTSGGALTSGVTSVGNVQMPVAGGSNQFFTATNWTGATDTQKIVFSTSTASLTNGLCSISGAGNLRCRGSITASVAPDVAEYVQTEPDVEPYEVVALSDSQGALSGFWGERVKVRRARSPYERGIIGVIAGPHSGLVIGAGFTDIDGSSQPGARPLALAGRVPVKVTLEGGPIRPGDALTASSTPGRAMRATEAGSTIGVALEAFEGEAGSEGRVMVFVDVGERGMSFYRERLREMESRYQDLEGRMKALEERLR